MRVVITGGGGFVGQRLARALLALGGIPGAPRLTSLLLTDLQPPTQLDLSDGRVDFLSGDLTDPELLEQLFATPANIIFHLGAIPSGGSEKAFDRGLAVNLDGPRALLEAARHQDNAPRFVYTSTTAVFGGALPDVVPDEWPPTPQSSYGTAKAMSELLINEYSRRGFVDGRSLRLPTIVVRGGAPNTATSTFASSIIREPLKGERATCPVAPETAIWILSPDQAAASLIHAAALPATALGDNRIINLPGLCVTVGEMVEALAEVAGPEAASLIDWAHDPFIQRIVGSWPARFAASRALDLGFRPDESMQAIIRAHIAQPD